MAAPNETTLLMYGCFNDPPENETDPYGGAIALDKLIGSFVTGPDGLNKIIAPQTPSQEDQTIYGIFYRKNISTGTLNNARFYNKMGLIPNEASGPVQLLGTNTTINIPIRITGYVDSVIRTEELIVIGKTPTVGLTNWDVNGILVVEKLIQPGTPVFAGTVTISCNLQTLGIFYGVYNTSLIEFAAATALNTPLVGDNKYEPPMENLGTFYQATKWAGNDNSIPIPTNNLGPNSYIAICVKMLVPAGIAVPTGGYLLFSNCLIGNPVD